MAEDVQVHCRSWSAARKHPHVLGVIAGWVSPWPSTAAQITALLTSAIVLVRTHGMWGPFVPGIFDAVIMFGVPAYLWWAARYLTIEGRSPARAAIGALSYLLRPRYGSIDGRPAPRPRRTSLAPAVLFIVDTRAKR